MPNFYTTLTKLGTAALAAAHANGTTVQFTHLAFGDGNGAFVTPTQNATALVKEIHRVPVSSITQDATNPNWIVFEGVILSTVGGWTVRELGLIGAGGKLLAVGNFPDTYKPVLEDENAARDLTIKMIVEVSAAGAVNMTVDPSVAVATNQSILNAIAQHEAKPDPHPQYALDSDLAAHILAADPHPQYMTDNEVVALLTQQLAAFDDQARTYFMSQT